MKKILILMTFIALISSNASAQNRSNSTNLVEYITHGTLNV